MFTVFSDTHFMGEALKEARLALEKEEIPVGAIVVSNNRIIARAHNLTEQLNDVTAHAEILAITAAAQFMGGKYLDEAVLYVTLEPCVMCAGALFWTRIGKVVIGAEDEKRGFLRYSREILHPKTLLVKDVMAEESALMLQEFFRSRRK